MVNELKIKAYAKLNLYLDMDGKRPNGYHNLNMIMQNISICDEVDIEITHDRNIEIISSDKNVPLGEENIVYKAVKLFYSSCMQRFSGVKINLDKHIPIQSGMGGGSADAAAVLVGLNSMEGDIVPMARLLKMGEKLGADVPFAIVGGTCAVRGIGEIITPLKPLKDIYFVVIKPKAGISTAEAYKRIDDENITIKDNFDEMVRATEYNDILEMKKYMQNAFERVCNIPEVELCKKSLLDEKAETAMMTGSGTAVFGIFKDKEKAEQAKENLKKAFDWVYLAEPINEGVYFVL